MACYIHKPELVTVKVWAPVAIREFVDENGHRQKETTYGEASRTERRCRWCGLRMDD